MRINDPRYKPLRMLADGLWKGQPAFVVGSGPSIKGLDLSRLLHEELTIGCNEEYRWEPKISICQDVRFFFGDGTPGRLPAKDNPRWWGNPSSLPVFFKGHPDRPDPPYDDHDLIVELKAATRMGSKGEMEFKWGTSLEEGLYYGANCGLAALNLADILGADPIYLLGFDCASMAGLTHHHGHYPLEWEMKAELNEPVFKMWAADFSRVKSSIRGRVINLCEWSGIDAFPRLPTETLFELLGKRGTGERPAVRQFLHS